MTAISLVVDFEATRSVVFDRWTNADHLAGWFAPPGYTTIAASFDARPGGEWRMVFRADSGHEYSESGVVREVDSPQRLVLTLVQRDGAHANPDTVVTVELEDTGTPTTPRTRMRFLQSGYRSDGLRADNESGWLACFTALVHSLEASGVTNASRR